MASSTALLRSYDHHASVSVLLFHVLGMCLSQDVWEREIAGHSDLRLLRCAPRVVYKHAIWTCH